MTAFAIVWLVSLGVMAAVQMLRQPVLALEAGIPQGPTQMPGSIGKYGNGRQPDGAGKEWPDRQLQNRPE